MQRRVVHLIDGHVGGVDGVVGDETTTDKKAKESLAHLKNRNQENHHLLLRGLGGNVEHRAEAGETHAEEGLGHVLTTDVDGISLLWIISIDVVGLAVALLLAIGLLAGQRMRIPRVDKAFVEGLSLLVAVAAVGGIVATSAVI